jgi:DNA-binding NarL/FixJ family response regulator
VVSPEIENMLANEPPIPELSSRQRDILESLTRGLTNNEIAMQFEISPESVKTHIAKLFEKIGAGNRSEAVSIALRKHLLKL